MRLARARSGRPLHFELLEDRVALSVSVGSLQAASIRNFDAMARPTGYSYPVGLAPQQVRDIYGFDDVNFGGIVGDGSGQAIAIVAAYNNPNITSDLAHFDQAFGLPAPPSLTIVNQYGGPKLPKNNRGWASETALDVEWAHAIAPGANILLVEAKNATSFGTAIDYARYAPGVTVVSVSAAGKEFKTERFADPLFTTPAGHSGITYVFASGDKGAKPEYPSASPNVLSIGGTTLHVTGTDQYGGETVWSDGGGGASKYEGAPSYQDGLSLLTRGTPDVAYNADPETGFAVFDSYGSGGWAQYGGTSAGTPQWAALLAIANQGRTLGGKSSLAHAQAALYALPRGDFHDVVFGSNGFSAASGYDLATGLGSPVANLLIPDLVAYDGTTAFTIAPLVASKAGKLASRLELHSVSYAMSEAPFAFDSWAPSYFAAVRLDSVVATFDVSIGGPAYPVTSVPIDTFGQVASLLPSSTSTESDSSCPITVIARDKARSGTSDTTPRPRVRPNSTSLRAVSLSTALSVGSVDSDA